MTLAPPHLLSNAEIREFQSLAAKHAGASLTLEQAEVLAHQLLRVLFVIREAVRTSSTNSAGPVDPEGLARIPDPGHE